MLKDLKLELCVDPLLLGLTHVHWPSQVVHGKSEKEAIPSGLRKPDASAAAAVGALPLRNHVVVRGHYLGILGPYTPPTPNKKKSLYLWVS